MAIRSVGGELGSPHVATFGVISSYRSTISVGAMVSLSTSSNWSVGAAGTGADLTTVGIVKDLAEDKSVATVQLLGYSKAFEAEYSGAISRGQYPVTTTGNKVCGSGGGRKHPQGCCAWRGLPDGWQVPVLVQ